MSAVSFSDSSHSLPWRFLLQSEMRSVVVVVTHILSEKSFQVTLMERDHMVKQVTSATSNPALSRSILPRTSD
jgi:hypothetical protein